MLISQLLLLADKTAFLISGDNVASPHRTLAAPMINLASPNISSNNKVSLTNYCKINKGKSCFGVNLVFFGKQKIVFVI